MAISADFFVAMDKLGALSRRPLGSYKAIPNLFEELFGIDC
jgi:hypothetical protein